MMRALQVEVIALRSLRGHDAGTYSGALGTAAPGGSINSQSSSSFFGIDAGAFNSTGSSFVAAPGGSSGVDGGLF
jgi:hypothetical protein